MATCRSLSSCFSHQTVTLIQWCVTSFTSQACFSPCPGFGGHLAQKIRADTSSNASEVRGAGFTPHKIHVQTLWISGLCHLGQFPLSPRESSLCLSGKAVFV